MKIGINASFLRKPGTGIGQVTYNVLRTLISHTQYLIPDTFEFFLYCEEEPKLDFVLPENFHIRVFLPTWKRDDVLRKILWERRVAYMARKDDCDAFLSLYQNSTIFHSVTNKRQKNIRHTMFVHDIIPKIFPEYRNNSRQEIYWRRVEKGIVMADHIVTISKHTKEDLLREYGIANEKIEVIYLDVNPQFHNQISPETIADVLRKYNLTPGYIYHGGGLEIRKNSETLLRAYKQLTMNKQQLTSNNAVPPLVISGKIFDTKNKLATDVRGLVSELHLEEQVRLLGFVPDEDLPALYGGALFFVYPSLYEGFGLPVLEALRMGTPVLSSNTSSLPEVGGDAVLYTDPKDEEEMERQMERLLSDESLRKTLIAKSSLQAVQFSWKQCVEKVFALIVKE